MNMILPSYPIVSDVIARLKLPYSVSQLHGLLCGYLTAGKSHQGEMMMRTLTTQDDASRAASRMLFDVLTVSQQQLDHLEFDFELLLPDEETALLDRAQAFTEWCEGFSQGLTIAGIGAAQLHDVDAQEALHHLSEFAKLDYHALHMGENDEKAFMEVTEYARMAVLQIHTDLKLRVKKDEPPETAH